jgi:hypothetical protein
VIGKRRGLDCSAGQIVEELVFVPASVEAVDEFLEVAIEMFVAVHRKKKLRFQQCPIIGILLNRLE